MRATASSSRARSAAQESAFSKEPTLESTSRACTRCIAKKRRCDHRLPSCHLCVKAKQPCEYPPENPRRGPIAGLSRLTENRLQEVENALYYVLGVSGVVDALLAENADTRVSLPAAPSAEVESAERARWYGAYKVKNLADVLDFRRQCELEGTQSNARGDAREHTEESRAGASNLAVLSEEISAAPATANVNTAIPLATLTAPPLIDPDLRGPLGALASAADHTPHEPNIFPSTGFTPGPLWYDNTLAGTGLKGDLSGGQDGADSGIGVTNGARSGMDGGGNEGLSWLDAAPFRTKSKDTIRASPRKRPRLSGADLFW